MAKRLWHWREQAFGTESGVSPFEQRYQALARDIDLIPWDSMPFPGVDANGLDLFPRYYVTTSSGFQANDIVAYTPTAGSLTYDDDQQAHAFIETNSAETNAFGVGLRISGAAGSESYYGADLNGSTGTFELYKYVAGVYTSLGTDAKTVSASNEGWFVRAEAVGTTIRAKCWRWDAVEPDAWDVSVTDAALTSGDPGLISYQNDSTPALGKPRFFSVDDGTGTLAAPRPKTQAELDQFSAGDAEPPMYLVEVGVLANTGVFGGVYTNEVAKACMATRPFVSSAVDDPAKTVYDDIIVEMPVMRSMATEIFSGRSTQDYGSLTISLEGGERDHWVGWNWDGRPVGIWVGGAGWERWDFVKVASCIVGGTEVPSPDRMVFSLRDKSAAMARKFQDVKVGGSGGSANRPAPYTLGYCVNVEPVLEDAAALQYRFDDGTHNDALIVITEVRDSGVSVAFTEETDADSGTFTLSATPTGQITGDFIVLTAETHPEIFFEVLSKSGDGTAYQGDGVGSQAEWTDAHEAGLHVSSTEEPTTGQVLDQVAASGGAFWWFDRLGYVRASQFDLPTAYHHHELLQDDVMGLRPERIILPSLAKEVYCAKMWTIQDAGSLAGAVTPAFRALYSSPGIFRYPPAILGTAGPADARYNLLSETPESDVWLYLQEADADAEVERRRNIFWNKTGVFQLEVQGWVPRFGMGETVEITHARFGFSAGATALIVGIEEDMNRGLTRLSVFKSIAESGPAGVTSSYLVVPETEFYTL